MAGKEAPRPDLQTVLMLIGNSGEGGGQAGGSEAATPLYGAPYVYPVTIPTFQHVTPLVTTATIMTVVVIDKEKTVADDSLRRLQGWGRRTCCIATTRTSSRPTSSPPSVRPSTRIASLLLMINEILDNGRRWITVGKLAARSSTVLVHPWDVRR
jgi:hypothetical protein